MVALDGIGYSQGLNKMVFPITYFGPIPYFQDLLKSPAVTFEQMERFPKQTWRNRMNILTANGVLALSVPCKKPNGKNTLTKEVVIDYDASWQKDHWGAIESAYRHAPYFFYYGDLVHDIIFRNYASLLEMNWEITQQIYHWLDFEWNAKRSEEFEVISDQSQDKRLVYSKKNLEHQQDRYIQVFSDTLPFEPNLSILDLLMNEGPLARKYILG
ncbi:MAG: WbqC family protein [Crocinitomicaceae bacterium]|nr:WbqC family protein [Crocinitomicaceae bacterium]